MGAHPDAKDPIFQAINTIMGNVKRYLLGIHHVHGWATLPTI